MRAVRNAYRVFVRKPETNRRLVIWEDNIRMDVRGIGCEGVEWLLGAWVRDKWRALVNTVMNLRVP